MPKNWKYIGDGMSPLPGFSPQDMTDAELKAAAETYAAHWPEENRKEAARLAIDVVTGKGRIPAAYVSDDGKEPASEAEEVEE